MQLIANVLKMWNCKFCKLSFFIRIKGKYEIVIFVKSAFFRVKELFEVKVKNEDEVKKPILSIIVALSLISKSKQQWYLMYAVWSVTC